MEPQTPPSGFKNWGLLAAIVAIVLAALSFLAIKLAG